MPRRKSKLDKLIVFGSVIIVLVLAAFSFIGTQVFQVRQASADFDPETSCKIRGERSMTVVLVDVTDPFTESQKTRLVQALGSVKSLIDKGDRFQIYTMDSVGPEGGSTKLLADACNPGDPNNADPLIQNPRLLAQAFEEKFHGPVASVLSQIVETESADNSPIITALEYATVHSFGPLSQDTEVSKRLIIVSDMMQNSAQLSFYRDIPEFERFKNSSAYRMHIPRLQGVEYEVWEINRTNLPSRVNRSDLALFWQNYLREFGGMPALQWWRGDIV